MLFSDMSKVSERVASRWLHACELTEDELGRLKGWGTSLEVEGNPPAWVANESIWDKAKKQVKENWSEYDEPYAVVADVYFKMGGEKK